MSFQDKLKQSQGSGSSAPTLSISKRIELKEIGGQAVFVTYDKDKKENIELDSPITGILIGEAMQMSSYSDDLGSKGGNYQSSYYFTNNDQVVLFAPTSKGYDIVCKGTAKTIEEYLVNNSTGKIAKKRRVLFVCNNTGLLAITTNLTIAIDQKKAIAEQLSSHYLNLHADTYKENETPISKTAKEYLGKFRIKNPPKFAFMELGEPITEEAWGVWGGERYSDEFTAFKKFKSSGGAEDAHEPTDKTEPEKVHYAKTANQMQGNPKAEESTKKNYTTENASTPSDDLPF